MKSVFALALTLAAIQASASSITYKTTDACTNKGGEVVLTVSTKIVPYDTSAALLNPIQSCLVSRAPQYPGDDDCASAVTTAWAAMQDQEVLSAKLERVIGGKTVLIGEAPILADFVATLNTAKKPATLESTSMTASLEHGLAYRTFSDNSWFFELADGSGLPAFKSPNVLEGVQLKVVNGQLAPLPSALGESLLADFSRANSTLGLFVKECKRVAFTQQ